MGSLLLSPGPDAYKVLFLPSKSLFPQSCVKFWWLYGGVNGDLLQEGLCHTHVCCTQSPCLCSRHFAGDTQNTVLAQSLWGLWVLVLRRFVWALWASLVDKGFDDKRNFTPPIIFLGLSLCPWTWGIFSVGIQHCPVDSCSARSCSFGVLTGENEHTSFYSTFSRSVFIPIPKKGNAKECSNCCTIALLSHISKVMLKIPGHFSFQSQRKAMPKNVQTTAQLHSSHTSKVMLKILQARLQQYMNRELPDVQAGFRKGRGTRDQIANIRWITEEMRECQKNIYFCFIDYAKAFDCVDHNKLWKILQEMGLSDHLTCLLWNLYAGQEATVRTGHGITDWFQIGKGVRQGCILSSWLFNLYAEYIMRNVGGTFLSVLHEAGGSTS